MAKDELMGGSRMEALPDYLTVKKDILDSRRVANKHLSAYLHYKNIGLNQYTIDMYFQRFSSSCVNLYVQLRPKLEIPRDAKFLELKNIDGFLYEESKSKMSKNTWLGLFLLMNDLIEALGISRIEIDKERIEGLLEGL